MLGALPLMLMLGVPASAAAAKPDSSPPPADSSPDILVEGHPLSEARQVERQARAITFPDDFHRNPIARFQDPVCPGIMGLPVDYAGLMVDRIRQDATLAGLDVAREGACTPNILVAFVRNGQVGLKEIAHTHGWLFESITAAEYRALLADPGPVHAWVNTVMRGRHGEAIYGGNPAAAVDAFRAPQLRLPAAHSHIYLPNRLDIQSAVVVIDLPAIEGLSTDQIADYVAMRAFARTRPVSGKGGIGTILSLFDPAGTPPSGLTPFDIAYLKGTYSVFANLPGAANLGAVREQYRKVVAEEEAKAAGGAGVEAPKE